MNILEIRGYAIPGHYSVKAHHAPVSHRGLNADIRRNAGNNQRLDSVVFQDIAKVSAYERAMYMLGNDAIAGFRLETL